MPVTYSETQRREMACRIVNDAEFVKRGAEITETGRLALVGSQLTYITLVSTTGVDERIVDKSDPPSHPMDAWLDTGLDEAWDGVIGGQALYNRFIRAGFLTLRDLLTAGKACVSKTHNAGDKYIGKLEQILATNPYGLEWQGRPEAEYVAGFCSRLSQVHAGALGLGRPTSRISVLDMLETPLKERPFLLDAYHMLRLQGISSCIDHSVFAETSNVPEIFAVRFELARQKMEYDHA